MTNRRFVVPGIDVKPSIMHQSIRSCDTSLLPILGAKYIRVLPGELVQALETLQFDDAPNPVKLPIEGQCFQCGESRQNIDNFARLFIYAKHQFGD